MIKNTLNIIIIFLFLSCEYEDFDDNKDVQSPLASCIDGVAKIPGTDYEYSCSNYDLMGHVSLEEMDAESANDIWGWTDSFGKEYAIIGLNNGTAFINISDPVKPVYLGKLPTQTISTIWRDIKIYKNFAYIVADFDPRSTSEEDQKHGLQVFDLTKLSGVNGSPVVFSNDYLYSDFGKAHNLAINEKTNFLYAIGTDTFKGGIHIVDLADPSVPVFSQGFSEQGYSHDAQVVTYRGPDTEHDDKEIFLVQMRTKLL